MRPKPLTAGLAVLICCGVSVTLGGAVPPGPAVAATASPPCTIRGTAQADHLVGTPGNDVICAGRGDDVIESVAGNDIIRAGAGDDQVASGRDADTIYAGDGNDTVDGMNGPDQIFGGPGDDYLNGNSGRDVINGEDGNDDIIAGPHRDQVDGGPGTNWCTVQPEDVSTGCVTDTVDPSADVLTTSTQQVDVTHTDGSAIVRVHVLDDTGVVHVDVRPATSDGYFPMTDAHLVSGDARDGWWEGTLHFHQFAEPGSYPFRVRLEDRVGRQVDVDFPDASLEVVDANPDVDFPRAKLLSPSPSDVFDVREHSQAIAVKARIIDAQSGLAWAQGCIYRPRTAPLNIWCAPFRRQSGDSNNGVYVAYLGVRPRDPGGTWDITVRSLDRAHSSAYGVFATGYDEQMYGDFHQYDRDYTFTNGFGEFSVVSNN